MNEARRRNSTQRAIALGGLVNETLIHMKSELSF